MEAAIPWMCSITAVERLANHAEFSCDSLGSLITGGSDNTSGPDAIPDNLGGMAEDSGQLLVIDNYVEIIIDADGNGLPDMGVFPNSWDRISYFKQPPFKATALSIKKSHF